MNNQLPISTLPFGDNFIWYSSNFNNLCMTHKDKIGQYCIISERDIKFADENLENMESAFKYFRKKYPELKSPLIILFGNEPLNTVFNGPISPLSKNNSIQTIVKNENFVSNFIWICTHLAEIQNIISKWIAVFENNFIELNVNNMKEAFIYLREKQLPIGSIVIHTDDIYDSFINASFNKAKYFLKKHISISCNWQNTIDGFINNMLFDPGADITVIRDWESIDLQGLNFGIGHSATINGSSLHFYVDNLRIAIPGLPLKEVVCGFPFNFKLIHQLYKYQQPIEKLSEFDEKQINIFSIGNIECIKKWIDKEYDEPNEQVKHFLTKCGVILWPNHLIINGLVGQTYLNEVDYEFKSSDKSLVFRDGQSSSRKYYVENLENIT